MAGSEPGVQGAVDVEIGFDRGVLPVQPALALVGAEHVRQFRGAEAPASGKERSQVRHLALPPQPGQPCRGTVRRIPPSAADQRDDPACRTSFSLLARAETQNRSASSYLGVRASPIRPGRVATPGRPGRARGPAGSAAPRPSPQGGSDFLPAQALAAQLNQLALFLAQALPHLFEQILARNHTARSRVPARQGQLFHPAHGAAAVAAQAVLTPHFFGYLVAGHGQQQLDQVVGLFQVVQAGGGAHEEDGEHRLTDVHRVELEPRAAAPEPGAATRLTTGSKSRTSRAAASSSPLPTRRMSSSNEGSGGISRSP